MSIQSFAAFMSNINYIFPPMNLYIQEIDVIEEKLYPAEKTA